MLNPWCPMFHLCPMVSHGNTMEIYGNPMVFHGAQGHTHGVPWKIHGVQWKSPWCSMENPRDTMEYFCKGLHRLCSIVTVLFYTMIALSFHCCKGYSVTGIHVSICDPQLSFQVILLETPWYLSPFLWSQYNALASIPCWVYAHAANNMPQIMLLPFIMPL